MKSRFYLTALLLFLFTAAVTTSAFATDKKPIKERAVTMTDEQKKARIAEIESRVYEIKAMDRSTLSKEDRKALRKELKEMNKEARQINGGLYISATAIIIILLVLLIV